jgi:hypothetical protein
MRRLGSVKDKRGIQEEGEQRKGVPAAVERKEGVSLRLRLSLALEQSWQLLILLP